MSLTLRSQISWLAVASVLAAGAVPCAASHAYASAVETYVDQAVPAPVAPDSSWESAPVRPGDITMRDVLRAYARKKSSPKGVAKDVVVSGTAAPPLLAPAIRPSTSGEMMMQGMRSVLRSTNAPVSAPVRGAVARAVAPQDSPASSGLQRELAALIGRSSDSRSSSPVPAQGQKGAVAHASAVTIDGVQYQPGQEPRSLGQAAAAAAVAVPYAQTKTQTQLQPQPQSQRQMARGAGVSSAVPPCAGRATAWVKTCAEAGYPETFTGEIRGETRAGCADGGLRDVWVSNTCSPPGEQVERRVASVSAPAPASAVSAQGRLSGPASSGQARGAGVDIVVAPDGSTGSTGVAQAMPSSSLSSVAAGPGAARCGLANGLAISRRPVADLCDSGQATDVSGDGPWRWSCKGASGGMTVSCAAPYVPDSAAGGGGGEAARSVAAPSGAVAAAGLVSQNPDARDRSGKILDGRCGTAAEVGVDRAPSANLCAQGLASKVSGEGPWSWACSGTNGGTAAACFAPRKADGFCGASHGGSFDKMPMAGLCGGGYASAVTGDGPWNWTCSGLYGGEAATCSATRVVNAVCGPASLSGHRKAPADQLCSVGQPSSVVGSGPWSWSCSGSHGGSQVACSSPVVADGKCGAANGVALPSAPSEKLCAQGSASRVLGDGPWIWSCLGADDGDSETCTAPRQQEALRAVGPAAAISAATTSATVQAASQGKETNPNRELVHAPRAPAGLGLCGSAAELAALVAPDHDLCARGSAGSVTGDGPWSWVCQDDKGIKETCSTLSLAEPPAVLAKPSAAVAPTAPVAPVALVGAAAAEARAAEAARSAEAGHPSDVPDRKPPVPQHGEVVGTLSVPGGMPAPSSAPSVPVKSDQPVALVAKPGKTSAAVAVKEDSSALASAGVAEATGKAGAAAAAAAAGVKAGCGAASGQGFSQVPSSDLCAAGSVAGLVSGDGPWTWECANDSGKVLCTALKSVSGACGSSNGAMLDRAPQENLCVAGAATEVYGSGPWLWTCVGAGGGGSSSCSTAAMQQARVDGVCGASAQGILREAPRTDLCDSGLASPVYGSGPWTWTCSGMNGGIASPCVASKSGDGESAAPSAPAAAVDGYCGSANGKAVSEQPVEGLCSTGTQTRLVGEGPWNWNCMGLNGGMSVSCTAPLLPPPPLDGACGSASGVPALVMPQGGLCSSGISSAVSGKGPWTWSCSGINGGGAVGCVAPFAGMSAGARSMPSLVTASQDLDKSGLVTPQLEAEVIPQRKPAAGLLVPPSRPQSAAGGIPPALARRDKEGVSAPLPPARSTEGRDSAPVSLAPPSLRGSERKAAGHSSVNGDMAVVPGNHFVLDDDVSVVAFANNDGNLNGDAVEVLDKLASVLASNKGVRVTLTAYAGNKDISPRDARRLSLSRGLAVRDYLSSKGIATGRMDVRALGSNVPSGDPDRVDIRAN